MGQKDTYNDLLQKNGEEPVEELPEGELIQAEETLEEQPTRWYCDTDCRASNRLCRGESGKDPTAKNLCPYYEDMLF